MAYMRAASNFPAAYVMNSFADLCFTTYLCQFKFDNFAAVQWVGTHATRGPGQKLSNTARCEISTQQQRIRTRFELGHTGRQITLARP